MVDEQLFYDLKEQVQIIDENLYDIKEKIISNEVLYNYPTKSEIEETYLTIQDSNIQINEIKEMISNKMDNQDLSIFITEDFLTEYVDMSSKNILNSVNDILSNIDTYTKYEIDERINNINLDNYITIDNIKSYNFVTSNEIENILQTKKYLTEHQSLIDYVKKDNFENIINDKLDIEFNSLKSFYDDKIQELREIYMSTLKENGYVTTDDIIKIITDSLVNYITVEKVNEILDNKDYSDKSYLHKHVEKYVTSKLSELNFITQNDIKNFITSSDIPVKVSDLVNDKGYLTEHQSLEDYVKKYDLKDYVTKTDFDLIISSLIEKDNENIYLTYDDLSVYAKLTDIPVKVSDLVNDKGYLTEHQSLSNYVKKSELIDYVTQDEFKHVKNSINNIDTSLFLTQDDLSVYAKLTDIPVKISDLYNDKEYLTEHQSLSAYVKKSELIDYVTQDEFKHVKNSINNIDTSLFLTQDDLNNYVTVEYADSKYLLKTDKPNLSVYVKSTDLSNYVKKSSLPNFDEFVKINELPNHEDYVTLSNINSLGFAKLIDIPDVSEFVNYSRLNLYLRETEFDKYKKQIDSKQYQTKNDIDNVLDNYVKKSDIGTASNLDINTINQMITEKINAIHVPYKVSELINDVGYSTFNESLSGYVKRNEISSFITMDDVDAKFLKIQDFIFPSDLVYKDDIKEFVSESDILKLTMDIVYKSQLSDYVLHTNYNKDMLKFENSFNVKLNEFENTILELISDVNDSNNSTNSDLDNYVRKDILDDFSIFEQYLDTKFTKINTTKSYVQTLDERISNQREWINDNFIKKSEYGDNTTVSVGNLNYDSLINDYYTKTESHLKFLSKEDYRGIKTAATINFEYNDYPDLFFEVLNNNEEIKINDGFYVIEEKAYIVRNNQIVPICDRRSPHWEIETEDENWRLIVDEKENNK